MLYGDKHTVSPPVYLFTTVFYSWRMKITLLWVFAICRKNITIVIHGCSRIEALSYYTSHRDKHTVFSIAYLATAVLYCCKNAIKIDMRICHKHFKVVIYTCSRIEALSYHISQTLSVTTSLPKYSCNLLLSKYY
jgi:hypothetical protein